MVLYDEGQTIEDKTVLVNEVIIVTASKLSTTCAHRAEYRET